MKVAAVVSAVLVFGFATLLLLKTGASRHPEFVVVNTWPFTEATTLAWKALSQGRSSLDAVHEV